MTTSMNGRTHFLIKIYLSHFILERVDVGCAREVSWRRGQTATYWPKVLLTIAALLPHLGWVAQPWVIEGPKPSVCRWHSIQHLVPNWLNSNWNWPKPSVAPGYIIVWRTPASAYLHRCISWLTARIHTFPKGISAIWKCKQSCLGFELGSSSPFPTTVTITSRACPNVFE